MIDFTVAIPTYNSADRLPLVLDKLRSQLHTAQFDWEIIVVDNNSSDTTAAVVRHYQSLWQTSGFGCVLRYVWEPEQGAAFARQRAIDEASGKWVGFLDDDNLPAADWVAAAYTFGRSHPNVGAYGSRIRGDFEVTPPADFERIACFLAIVERGTTAHQYEPREKLLPPGAGLVVRKQAWKEAVPKRLVLNHTGKAAKLASEDLEVVLHIQKAGWEIWHNPMMQIDHKIPQWRLERNYLISLVQCVGLSRHHLRMMRLQPWRRPIAIPIYLGSDVRKLLMHWLKYRGAVEEDIVSACEREFLFSTILSPFHLWKKAYLKPPLAALPSKSGSKALGLETLTSKADLAEANYSSPMEV